MKLGATSPSSITIPCRNSNAALRREVGWGRRDGLGWIGRLVAAGLLTATAWTWAAPTNSISATTNVTEFPVKAVAPGIFEIGDVRLDRNKREVSFPCAVNMDRGLIEYALVHSRGKVHESLLRTDVEPYHIHLAVLLLGTNGEARAATWQSATTRSTPDGQAGERTPFIGHPEGPVVHRAIPGEKVSVSVRWRAGGVEKQSPIEDWIYNLQTQSTARRGEWIYNGSRLADGKFLAQLDGSILAIIEDLSALINNPRSGRENDEIWQANSASVPPPGTPLQLIIKLN